MKTIVLAATLAGIVALTGAAEARDWTRHGTVTTPRGIITKNADGSCEGGTCNRTRSRTGVNGRTVTEQGTATHTENGATGSRVITGPNGKTVTQQGSVTKSGDGQLSYDKETTGPNGKTVERQGTVTVTPPAN
jgi:hypothetical protein